MAELTQYEQVWNTWNSGRLRTQTKVAAMFAAYGILSEDPATENHSARVDWANEVIDDPERAAARLLFGVVVNSAVLLKLGEASDQDVQEAVNGLVTNIASTKTAKVG